ncbi:hypothetical protein HSBAA_33300 [Vreelandella sulfidaeris]|uniref:PAS domain-containing protein n=1 Tax=Vreelandella sulfidaeris TaxID=115553 RepID=A0A455UG78_9GAMM|nr:hypothetical protein HSBAA_33300 [Halomonas sulfidaeris]
MLLGPSESLDHQSEAFSVVDKESRIYQVAEGSLPPRLLEMPGPSRRRRSPPYQEADRNPAVGTNDNLTRNVECLLALQFAPPSVIVNDRGEVVYVHGRTGLFLEPASGPARNQLLEMARPGLREPLNQALQKVANGDTDLVSRQVQVLAHGSTEGARLEVQLIRTPKALAGFRLVALHHEPMSEAAKTASETIGPKPTPPHK